MSKVFGIHGWKETAIDRKKYRDIIDEVKIYTGLQYNRRRRLNSMRKMPNFVFGTQV
jgi:hypothetical protein